MNLQTQEDLADIVEILDQRIYELADPGRLEREGFSADQPHEGEIEQLREVHAKVNAVMKRAA